MSLRVLGLRREIIYGSLSRIPDKITWEDHAKSKRNWQALAATKPGLKILNFCWKRKDTVGVTKMPNVGTTRERLGNEKTGWPFIDVAIFYAQTY
ncbi:hypothetical protein BOTNAR_0039g00230 [Botryotinia narcissicola]|uniref:Uncharacterized protein n=1 Tax=Botryotinia narcissicola TaxID=278944 RepID=A0A4Z1J1W9_9HELO|nr:hypothetical protein BOTNAR_0039g00230 [Botryotinia narcissicola]